jgi:hypothetical protein
MAMNPMPSITYLVVVTYYLWPNSREELVHSSPSTLKSAVALVATSEGAPAPKMNTHSAYLDYLEAN